MREYFGVSSFHFGRIDVNFNFLKFFFVFMCPDTVAKLVKVNVGVSTFDGKINEHEVGLTEGRPHNKGDTFDGDNGGALLTGSLFGDCSILEESWLIILVGFYELVKGKVGGGCHCEEGS